MNQMHQVLPQCIVHIGAGYRVGARYRIFHHLLYSFGRACYPCFHADFTPSSTYFPSSSSPVTIASFRGLFLAAVWHASRHPSSRRLQVSILPQLSRTSSRTHTNVHKDTKTRESCSKPMWCGRTPADCLIKDVITIEEHTQSGLQNYFVFLSVLSLCYVCDKNKTNGV